MKGRFLAVPLLILLMLTACQSNSASTDEPVVSTTAQMGVQGPNNAANATTSTAGTPSINCLGDQINPIGQAIADDYESASYEQVITWFCNGAEFEDILVALETEAQSGTPVDEMLQMLAGGFTWEDIWQVVGLTK